MFCAISIFWIFKDKVSIGENKVISFLAKTSLGVYMIHENSLPGGSNSLLWCSIFHLNELFFSEYIFEGYYVLDVMVVHMVYVGIETVRIKFVVEKYWEEIYIDKICKKIDGIYQLQLK